MIRFFVLSKTVQNLRLLGDPDQMCLACSGGEVGR